jgi:hypothetical protein
MILEQISVTFSTGSVSSTFGFDTSIDVTTGYLRFLRGSIDFEKQSKYEFAVTVTDVGGENSIDHQALSRTRIIDVVVLNVNEKPFTPDFNFCISENTPYANVGGPLKEGFMHENEIEWMECGSLNAKLMSTDVDDGDLALLEYSVVNVVPTYDVGSSGFTIEKSTGQLKLECNLEDDVCLDYERQQNYTISIKTVDTGNLHHISTVFIQVVDVNEAPIAVLPEGEEFITCGGTYAGPQLADIDGVNVGMASGSCIGCPMLFNDLDAQDEPTSYQCANVLMDGSCADIFDGGKTGFTITQSGDICATTDIDATFTATLRQRRRRLRSQGRHLAIDDVTVCYNITVTDSGNLQLGDKITSNETVVCVTIKDQNYSPTMSNFTFIVPETIKAGSRIGERLDGHDIDTVNNTADKLTYAIVRNVSGTSPGWSADVFEIDASTGWIIVINNSHVDDRLAGSLIQKDDAVQGLIPSRTLNYEQQQIFSLTVSVGDDGGCSGRKLRDSTVDCAPPLETGQPRCEDCCSAVDKGPFSRECCKWDNKDGVRPQAMCDPNLSVTRTITIIVEDENEPPRINADMFAIEENSESASSVGGFMFKDNDCKRKLIDGSMRCGPVPVIARDDDAGQMCSQEQMELDTCDENIHLTFNITGNSEVFCRNCGSYSELRISANDLFLINRLTGQIYLTDIGEEMLDFEEKKVWRVEVEVTDSGILTSGRVQPRLSHRRNMSIFIVDVNEVPVLEQQTYYVSEDADRGTFVGIVKAFDVDRVYINTPGHLQIQFMWDSASPIYTLYKEAHGNLGGAFEISPNGTITVSSEILDFEDTFNYTIVVRIIDDGGFNKNRLSSTQIINILLNDTSDAFVNSFQPSHQPQIGAPNIEEIDGEIVMLTKGGQKIDIVGSNFGSKHGGQYDINVTYGVTGVEMVAKNCFISINYTTITCDTVPGVGKNIRWIVHVKDLIGTSWQRPLVSISPPSRKKTRYHAPEILSMLNHQSMVTQGGDTVIIEGSNFGPVGTPVSGSYGSKKSFPSQSYEALCQITKAPELANETNGIIECITSPGVGKELFWQVIVTEQNSNFYGMSRYALPTVSGVDINSTEGSFFQTTGGESFILNGDNFGGEETTNYFDGSLSDLKLRVFYGSKTLLSKIDSDYIKRDMKILPKVLIQLPDWPQAYEGSVLRNNNDTTLDVLVDRITLYEASGCVVLSHTQIKCVSISGKGKDYNFQVTVVGQSSLISTINVRYAIPTVYEVIGPGAVDASTAGRQMLEFSGSNFGPAGVLSGFVSYGHPLYQINDPSSCRMCSGHGSCIRNTATNLTDADCVGGDCTCSCNLGYVGVKCGTCLSSADSICDVRNNLMFSISSTNNGFDMFAIDCRITTPHSRIRCLSSPGTGRGHFFVVNIEGQTSMPLFGNNSYAVPVIETYSGEGVQNARTSGGQVVILNGREFGSVSRNKIDWVKYGKINSEVQFVATDCRVIVDFVKILCKTAPGAGKDLQWRVSIDNQESVLHTTNYGAPQLTEVFGITTMFSVDDTLVKGNIFASTDGGDVVTVSGKNFGPPKLQSDIFVAVTYGPSGSEYKCIKPVVKSHTRIECVMVAGIGSKLYWKVYIHDQNSSVSTFWTAYSPPVITSIRREIPETDDIKFPFNTITGETANVVTTRGGDTVRIWGKHFGILAPINDISILFDGAMYDLKWNERMNQYVKGVFCMNREKKYSECKSNETLHYVDFEVPEGQGLEKKIQVCLTDSVRVMRQSKKSEVNYGVPKVLGVNIFEGKTDASRTLFVRGINFGKSVKLGSVRVSQRITDFLPNPPQMPVRRVGVLEQ